MKKTNKGIPGNLKPPFGQIASACKGRLKNDFTQCQRKLSGSCLHHYNLSEASKDAFVNCLQTNVPELPKEKVQELITGEIPHE